MIDGVELFLSRHILPEVIGKWSVLQLYQTNMPAGTMISYTYLVVLIMLLFFGSFLFPA